MGTADSYGKYHDLWNDNGILWIDTLNGVDPNTCGLQMFTYRQESYHTVTRERQTSVKNAWVVGGREQALLLINQWNANPNNLVLYKYTFVR